MRILVRRPGLTRSLFGLTGAIAICLFAATPTDAARSSRHAQAAGQRAHAAKAAIGSHRKQARLGKAKRRDTGRAATSAAKPPLTGELGIVQKAVGLARQGKITDAGALVKPLGDPAAEKLVEWLALRYSAAEVGFDRYATFIRANPDWPGIATLRRRAEARLWRERRNAATVRGFTGGQPESAAGRLALARVLIGEGDQEAAEREIRAVWRLYELSPELETTVLDAFGDVLTRFDHVARMNRRVGKKDFAGAMRAARRLDEGAVAIVKACDSALGNEKDARKRLDAVPSEWRDDLGYLLCRIHFLLRNDAYATATELMLSVSPDTLHLQDTDEWWRKRRTLARKLLDLGEPENAYKVVRAAAPPDNPFYRADFHFMAGWIALRFLSDPATALAHFAHVDDRTTNPIVLARAAYWRGRAYEAAGLRYEMQRSYEVAAFHPTAYYGQLARARLGLGELELRPTPDPALAATTEVIRAAELIYAIGERELALSFLTAFAEESDDAAGLAAVAELAARHNHARAVMLVGKAGLARGLPLEVYAFPDTGVPHFTPIGPALDRSMVYSIVRTESEFNQRDVSPAKAVGLMQVTPEAGRDTAKRFSVAYDWKRLVNDSVYNAQIGSAELAALLKDYRGNYIMSFAGYNAGRGRVQEWVARYGDPRAADVDAIDWVERIPFSETRNYVQRVMENLLVYRTRFGEVGSNSRSGAAEGTPSPGGQEALLSAPR